MPMSSKALRLDPGRADPVGGRPAVQPTRVVRASIDRLLWVREPNLEVRHVHPRAKSAPALARSRSCSLHLATDVGGHEAFTICGSRAALDAREFDLRLLAEVQQVGFDLPVLVRRDAHVLWLGRTSSLRAPRTPDPAAVGRYVAAAVRVALVDGLIVGTGLLLESRAAVVCLDPVVVRIVEPDERIGLAHVWEALVTLDAVGLCDAVSSLCRFRPPGLASASQRAVLSLTAQWSPTSLGLSLHHVAAASVSAGPLSEPLVLLADELLHRLDLAHGSRVRVEELASPSAALRLLVPLPVRA